MHCCLPTFTPILDCCVLGRPYAGSFQEGATPGQVRRIRVTMGQGAPYSLLEISGRALCDIVSLAFPRMSKTALLRPPPDVLRLAFPGLRRGETLERPFFRKTYPVIFNSFPFYWTLFLVKFLRFPLPTPVLEEDECRVRARRTPAAALLYRLILDCPSNTWVPQVPAVDAFDPKHSRLAHSYVACLSSETFSLVCF